MKNVTTWNGSGRQPHSISIASEGERIAVAFGSGGVMSSFTIPPDAAMQFASQLGLIAMDAMNAAEENQNRMRQIGREGVEE
jgi:hypothetical protein